MALAPQSGGQKKRPFFSRSYLGPCFGQLGLPRQLEPSSTSVYLELPRATSAPARAQFYLGLPRQLEPSSVPALPQPQCHGERFSGLQFYHNSIEPKGRNLNKSNFHHARKLGQEMRHHKKKASCMKGTSLVFLLFFLCQDSTCFMHESHHA